MILQKVKATEKIVRMIEAENLVAFETDKSSTKTEIAKEVEKLFNVKVKVYIQSIKKKAIKRWL